MDVSDGGTVGVGVGVGVGFGLGLGFGVGVAFAVQITCGEGRYVVEYGSRLISTPAASKNVRQTVILNPGSPSWSWYSGSVLPTSEYRRRIVHGTKNQPTDGN